MCNDGIERWIGCLPTFTQLWKTRAEREIAGDLFFCLGVFTKHDGHVRALFTAYNRPGLYVIKLEPNDTRKCVLRYWLGMTIDELVPGWGAEWHAPGEQGPQLTLAWQALEVALAGIAGKGALS